MATKKKTPAKKPAAKPVAKKAAKPAAKAASKPVSKPASRPAPKASRSNTTPSFVNDFSKFAKKNPAAALVGVIVVALGLMLIFG